MEKQFSLKAPCANCPFRNDGRAIELNPGRREDIIEALLTGRVTTFHCHATAYRRDGRNFDEDGNYRPVDVAHCPGAAAVAEKFGRRTVAAQLAIRLGVITEDHYDAAKQTTLDPVDLRIDPQNAHLG